MALDRIQLAKILELLGSAHDGEALAAARRAHALVKSAGESWESVLADRQAAPVGTATEPHTAHRPSAGGPRRGREVTSYEMFYALMQSARTPAPVKRWLKPLESKFLEGDVSQEQLTELRDMFRRYIARPASSG